MSTTTENILRAFGGEYGSVGGDYTNAIRQALLSEAQTNLATRRAKTQEEQWEKEYALKSKDLEESVRQRDEQLALLNKQLEQNQSQYESTMAKYFYGEGAGTDEERKNLLSQYGLTSEYSYTPDYEGSPTFYGSQAKEIAYGEAKDKASNSSGSILSGSSGGSSTSTTGNTNLDAMTALQNQINSLGMMGTGTGSNAYYATQRNTYDNLQRALNKLSSGLTSKVRSY